MTNYKRSRQSQVRITKLFCIRQEMIQKYKVLQRYEFVCLYSCQSRVPTQKDLNKIQPVCWIELSVKRLLDRIWSNDIGGTSYKYIQWVTWNMDVTNCKQHLNRTASSTIPTEYEPKGHHGQERPRIRWGNLRSLFRLCHAMKKKEKITTIRHQAKFRLHTWTWTCEALWEFFLRGKVESHVA